MAGNEKHSGNYDAFTTCSPLRVELQMNIKC